MIECLSRAPLASLTHKHPHIPTPNPSIKRRKVWRSSSLNVLTELVAAKVITTTFVIKRTNCETLTLAFWWRRALWILVPDVSEIKRLLRSHANLPVPLGIQQSDIPGLCLDGPSVEIWGFALDCVHIWDLFCGTLGQTSQ